MDKSFFIFQKSFFLNILIFIFFISWNFSCVSVASYQKMYLNDEDMELKTRGVENYELSFESYREGASGANGGKSGGGCGCN
ncbi:DUF4266 domain-containing protein [Flexithrix dorotheae]|uniref:DUF4266 domain-containing protein n=1 Tax=Flexithrix dorotheae TaxID=70993 RepID=UPI000379DF1B|nr:DUF4266 domain-containing protein [Flexithrix dorotheae]